MRTLLSKHRQLPLKIIDVPKIKRDGIRFGFLLFFRPKIHD